ncbi:single-stranded-DNA-specific exonuclease RecJ [Nicoliella spurrieriana]|uniref:Single-stranded-DNA-specific exonuclease RecJ n=1 Tax=Nicoliella spurrieriana TaxID=2925830 RepID=A0A976RRM6_9LACO|nr:single-stranded-DNA-specific exonuclease RecJ [Nicoliella spurrieriana]UQS86485.1 single-stranded-DNA-specific exonuclease RecJ [Nicoliella spurrieriana]
MIDSKYEWQLVDSNQDLSSIQELSTQLNLNPIALKILFQRGIKTTSQIRAFLNPDPNDLADPFLFHDMDKGVARITEAVENGEQITVYGDYDADGLTSTAIMYETLTEMGANVDYYIPNRFNDGYGPNVDAFSRIIDGGTTLIVTVDNGVTGFEPVTFANQHNCDVIITDHHEIPEQGVPDAYAVIHARYPGAEYPFGYFSGAGVAFKVATALLDELPQECLDLVTIGTVADLVSLTGENRILTKFGCQAIQNTQRPGLIKLLELASLTNKPINEHSIGFGIAPRLNALGRMGDANAGVELLTTLDDEQANELSQQTELLNKQRRKLVSDIFKAACEQVDHNHQDAKKTLVVAGPNWHEGVVGIVASRLVDKYHKPTLVLNIDPKTGIAKGSGRSIEGFNLFKALQPARDEMLKFGGHDMAVGLSVKKSLIERVASILENNFKAPVAGKTAKPNLMVDAKIDVDQIDKSLSDSLTQMAPFGTDNSQPLFEVTPKMVNNVQTMGNRNAHLRFTINGEQHRINAVAFSKGNLLSSIQATPNAIEMVGTIEVNTWNNRTSLQMMVKDLKSDGIEILDRRTKQLNQRMFKTEGTYVFFNRKLLNKLTPYINEKSNIIWYNDLSTEIDSDVVTIVDCPDTIDDLKRVAHFIGNSKVVLYLFKPHYIYSSGLPTRSQFGQLFRILGSLAPFNINQQLPLVVQKLGLDRNLTIFMIKVFQELKFVQIDNGLLQMNPNPKKQDLISANSYHNRQIQLESEKQLLLPNSATLVTLFNSLLRL